jgi:hypothetical protein
MPNEFYANGMELLVFSMGNAYLSETVLGAWALDQTTEIGGHGAICGCRIGTH